jgi:UDP-hydrolysing UDP-N-acetyl-D-glucosamine 2-epimerase
MRRPGDFARNLAEATLAFAGALAACEPDLLLVLGDRFEILAAALAATDLGLPIAHVHGGELSEGSLDDATRHCVTKLAHLHFVATRTYAERVCQLGEDPSRVYVVGAPGLESIESVGLLDRPALASALALEELPAPLIALTFHPASRRADLAGAQTRALTAGVEEVLAGAGCVVITLPNDDPGNATVREKLSHWAGARENVHAFAALGQQRYLSLLRHADVVLGNSSSAIIEAPSFRVPVVNVGERQRGRVMAANVLGCTGETSAIVAALRRALEPAFRASLASLENPYDQGGAAARILAVLSSVSPRELSDKRFFDLSDMPWRAQLQFAVPR